MIFADTGWFVALVDQKDALHPRAVRWLRALDEPVVTTEPVLLETFNSLSDLAKRGRCHETIQLLLSSSNIRLLRDEADYFDKGMRLHQDRQDKTWSLTDCMSFIVMTELGVTRALAHDRHFEQAGFEAMLRREPG